MDREEILARSRAENRGQDEREKAAMARAGQVASAAGGIVSSLVLTLNAIFGRMGDASTFVAWAVYLSITGSILLVKYQKLGKKHELVFGLAQIALALTFFAFYVRILIK